MGTTSDEIVEVAVGPGRCPTPALRSYIVQLVAGADKDKGLALADEWLRVRGQRREQQPDVGGVAV